MTIRSSFALLIVVVACAGFVAGWSFGKALDAIVSADAVAR